MKKFLFIFTNQPYNGTDNAYNALRLARALKEKGRRDYRIFLMNDAVDLARNSTKKPENYDVDLVAMLKELYASGAMLKVCGSCQTRCGLHVGEPYFEAEVKGSMDILSEWVRECDQVMTF